VFTFRTYIERPAWAELNSRLGIECITDVVYDERDCGGLVMWRERILLVCHQRVEVLKLME